MPKSPKEGLLSSSSSWLLAFTWHQTRFHLHPGPYFPLPSGKLGLTTWYPSSKHLGTQETGCMASISDSAISHPGKHWLGFLLRTVFCLPWVACRQCLGIAASRQTPLPSTYGFTALWMGLWIPEFSKLLILLNFRNSLGFGKLSSRVSLIHFLPPGGNV